MVILEFTPLEFETEAYQVLSDEQKRIRIYSVGVWNIYGNPFYLLCHILEFTPLEFETRKQLRTRLKNILEFTQLEFETCNEWG